MPPSPLQKSPRPGALLNAVMYGSLADVKRLLREGADPNETDKSGNSVLCRAITYGHMASARLLIDSGASPDSHDRNGTTALMMIISTYAYGQEDIIRTLLRRGARLDLTNNEGETAMSIAVRKSRTSIIPILNEAAARKRPAGEFTRTAAPPKSDGVAENQRRLNELAKKLPRPVIVPQPPKMA